MPIWLPRGPTVTAACPPRGLHTLPPVTCLQFKCHQCPLDEAKANPSARGLIINQRQHLDNPPAATIQSPAPQIRPTTSMSLPSHRQPHMLSLPKRLCLVPHGNTISTSRQFPALESTNAPNSDRFSTRPFHTSRLDSTQHQPSKQLVGKFVEERQAPPDALTSKADRAKPKLHDKGAVFCSSCSTQVNHAGQRLLFCAQSAISVFQKPGDSDQFHCNCLADRVGRKQSSAVRRQLHSGIVSQYSGIHPIS